MDKYFWLEKKFLFFRNLFLLEILAIDFLLEILAIDLR